MRKVVINIESINLAGVVGIGIISFIALLIPAFTVPAMAFNLVINVLLCGINRGSITNTKRFIWFFLCLASMAVTNILFPSLGSTFVLLNLLLMVAVLNNVLLPHAAVKKCQLVISLLLIIYAATCDYSRFVYSRIIPDMLGNSVNGNTLGMLILIAYFHMCNFLFNIEKRKRIYVYLAIATVICIYYLNITGCRTSIASIIVFIFLCLFRHSSFSNIQYWRLIRFELCLCLVFPIIYIICAERLENIRLMGKTIFSGRETVWKSGFELIKQYPLFGCGSDMMYQMGSKLTVSAHNLMIGIIKQFGLIPAITSFVFLGYPDKKSATRNKISQFVFLSVLLIGFTESSFIEASISPFAILLLLNSNDNKDSENLGDGNG